MNHPANPEVSVAFTELGLTPELLKATTQRGYKRPTPIQAAAIPPALAGRDVLGCAPTGSGKTAAFALALLQRAVQAKEQSTAVGGGAGSSTGSSTGNGTSASAAPATGPRSSTPAHSARRPTLALVLVPTRELAAQVGDSIRALAAQLSTPLKLVIVYGGVSINPQMLALRSGAEVVVATPGRLLDLAAQNAITLGDLQVLVLDEADRLLDAGFADEVQRLTALLPAQRQTLLFSATFPQAVQSLAQTLLREPVQVDVTEAAPHKAPVSKPKAAAVAAAPAPPVAAAVAAGPAPPVAATSPVITSVPAAAPAVAPLLATAATPTTAVAAAAPGAQQRAITVDAGQRTQLLRHLIELHAWPRALVFVATRYASEHVAEKLRRSGLTAAAFHGELSQGARTEALEQFNSGAVQVLLATDLAARGLHIPGLPVVVNFDLPRSPVDYTHRIGRTARAGASGAAISFVSALTESHFRLIEKRNELSLPREALPGFEPKELPPNLTTPTGGGIKGKRPNKKDKLRAAKAARRVDFNPR